MNECNVSICLIIDHAVKLSNTTLFISSLQHHYKCSKIFFSFSVVVRFPFGRTKMKSSKLRAHLIRRHFYRKILAIDYFNAKLI